MSRPTSRREFLQSAACGFPFFWRRPRTISLAGAHFRIVRHDGGANRYLVIHGSERTAWQVLERHIEKYKGTAFLIENDRRNVAVLDGVIDPNRMFSRAGAEANLKRQNPAWSEEQLKRALDLLDRHREPLVRSLLARNGARTVALHNNSEGYSVKDEIEISDRTSIKQPDNPHAFFLATDPRDFEALAAGPYNVVLQAVPKGDEDGSLSRLAARRHVRYVNLEVALGDFERQREMMEWLERNLK